MIIKKLLLNISANKRIWILFAGFIMACFGFGEVVDDVFYDPLKGDMDSKLFDESIFSFFNDYRNHRLNQAMKDLTALGSVSVIGTLLFTLVSVLLTYKDLKGLMYLLVVGAGAALWPFMLKPYFGRVRPEKISHLVTVSDLSFPSGHSFGASAVYIALAFYAGRYARSWHQELSFYVLGAIIIALVATSRVYLGVHYPTDVLAGLAGGTAWGLLVSAMFELRFPNNRKRSIA